MNHLEGIDHPLAQLDKGTFISTLNKTIERGNHKSSLSDEEHPCVTKWMEQDVELGYVIPFTLDCVHNLKDTEIHPFGIKTQETMNERGDIIPKKCMTYDLSFDRWQG